MVDQTHRWIVPALECSVALLIFAFGCCICRALLRAGILTQTPLERSFSSLWPRLACGQTLLFVGIELAEGSHVGPVGILIQICVALFAAYALSVFSRLITECVRLAVQASLYCDRVRKAISVFVAPCAYTPRMSLTVCAGTSRLKRPPPQLALGF